MTDEHGVAEALDALRAQGGRTRAEVLGEAYAAGTEQSLSPSARELYDFFLATGWGAVWNRPNLTRRERALATLSAAAATGRLGEVRAHTRGAFHAGMTAAEIREVIVQVAAYCGIGVAAEAMGAVQEILEELGAGRPE